MIALFASIGLGALIGWLCHEITTVPEGYEDPSRGFVRGVGSGSEGAE